MMAREYSAAPRHSPNSPSAQVPSGQVVQQMRSEASQTTSSGILEIAASTQTHIERLKSRMAELEKRLYRSRAETHQVTAEMKQLQRTIHQRDQQVARLENEKRALQFQVGCSNRVWCIPSFLFYLSSFLIYIIIHLQDIGYMGSRCANTDHVPPPPPPPPKKNKKNKKRNITRRCMYYSG